MKFFYLVLDERPVFMNLLFRPILLAYCVQ